MSQLPPHPLTSTEGASCHLHEARDVPEAGQRAVGAQHVGGDDDATVELDTEHRCPGHHGVSVEWSKRGVSTGNRK